MPVPCCTTPWSACTSVAVRVELRTCFFTGAFISVFPARVIDSTARGWFPKIEPSMRLPPSANAV